MHRKRKLLEKFDKNLCLLGGLLRVYLTMRDSLGGITKACQTLMAKTKAKNTLSTSALSSSVLSKSQAPFSSEPVFSGRLCSFPFSVAIGVPLAAFDISCNSQLHLSFVFLNNIPACQGNVSVFLLCILFLFIPLLYAFFCIGAQLFGQTGLLIRLHAFLSIQMDHFCA